MTPEQLKYVKDRIRKFYLVVEPICTHWESNQKHLATLSVLLQNMQFSGVDCYMYSHEEAVTKFKETHKLVNSICDYINSHFENWIKDELDSIINFESIHFDE